MKFYTVQVELVDTKKCEFVTASDEEEAIDKVIQHYTKDLNKEVIDIKII